MGESVGAKQREWTTVAVPRALHSLIKAVAEREKRPAWSVVQQAVSFYYAQSKQPRLKENLSLLEKVSWYVVKVCMSCGAFKEDPSDEKLRKLEKAVSEAAARLGVPEGSAALLLRTARAYASSSEAERKRLRTDVNVALKMFVVELLTSSRAEVEEEL